MRAAHLMRVGWAVPRLASRGMRRIRMQLVAAATPEELDANATNGGFHMVAIVQGVETGDGRIYESVTWRDLPLPVTAQDWQDVAHMNAVLIGNITRVDYVGDEVHAWGPYLNEPDEEAARLIGLVKSGELRGVSADLDDIEFEVLIPVESADQDDDGTALEDDDGDAGEPMDELDREEIDGQEYVVLPIPQEKLRVTESRLMGATILPFPALQEAWVEDQSALADDAEPAEAIVASARPQLTAHHVTGVVLREKPAVTASAPATAQTTTRERPADRFTIPEIPPVEWFEVAEPPGGPMPLTIMDDGQVFGHLAVWGECHIGVHGECVVPPESKCNYARFHTGEIPVDGGRGRVSCGRLTFHVGHAAKHLGAGPALDHYDHSGSVAADLRASNGEYGIWVCGAMRSGLTVAQIREIMSCPPSGDWRSFGGDLELIAALAVPVAGFNTPRDMLVASGFGSVRREDGLVETLIASRPAGPTRLVASGADDSDPELDMRIMELVAASIGRSTEQRVAALVAQVHGR